MLSSLRLKTFAGPSVLPIRVCPHLASPPCPQSIEGRPCELSLALLQVDEMSAQSRSPMCICTLDAEVHSPVHHGTPPSAGDSSLSQSFKLGMAAQNLASAHARVAQTKPSNARRRLLVMLSSGINDQSWPRPTYNAVTAGAPCQHKGSPDRFQKQSKTTAG